MFYLQKPASAPKTVPARATTPGPSTATNAPSTRKHAATPSSAQGGPNKRQRVNTNTGSVVRPSSTTPMPSGGTGRVPFGSVNGNRLPSGSTHAGGKQTKSTRASHAYNPPPPPKNAHNIGLGHPSGGLRRPPTVSASTGTSRAVSGTVRMATARKRESFRPRASIDSAVFGMGGLQNMGKLVVVGGVGERLQEEDEDDVF